MMSILRKQWSLHTPAGPVPLLDGSSWGFDRSWAPQGAGTLVLPLDDPAAASIVELDREPLRIVCDLWNTVTPAPLGTGAFVGSTLGTAAWPDETVTTYDQTLPDDGSTEPPWHERRAWHCWPRRIRRDEKARTLTVEVATVELLLVEARNGGDPWLPLPNGPNGTYVLSDVLLQLTTYVGVQVTVEAHWTTIPASAVTPWERGESAWDWWQRLRIASVRAYLYDPTLNRISIRFVTDVAMGVPPTYWLERLDELGGVGRQDQAEYADALLVRWTWTDLAGVAQERTDLALAAGVATWRDARALREVALPGPPSDWYPQHIVDVYSKLRNLVTLELPLDQFTLDDLGGLTGLGVAAQTIQYAIGDEPTVTYSIITE